MPINVNPRYTPGSPAILTGRDAELTHRLVQQERDEYKTCLSGIYGLELKARAEKLGLGAVKDEDGRPHAIIEYAKEKKDGWHVEDIVTGERFIRPFRDQARRKAR